ncbi:pyrroline-5-carboxylate reductase [Planctomycetales bacterium]|nr:pyrroline-5-carboxylate reductase [Planctomycetales bacterium]GHT45995.1 pyrroline-5-carboxylate reductase [Planctomycetales bacterium]
MDKKIGFIGTGHMARALAQGFLKTHTLTSEQLFGFDVNPEAAQRYVAQTGGKSVDSIKELVASSDVVFIAVKPQQMGEVLRSLGSLRAHGFNPLWVTIAAGMPIKTYLKDIGNTARLIRVMPNAPCLVGAGVSGFCVSEGTTPNDVKLATDLLNTVGIAVQFPERQLDAVAGLSGSGPAYVYLMIEALADGGVKMGLSREHALELATHTVFGSAKVVLETGTHPGVLKDKVCSPRGTTISGIHALERSAFRSTVIDAVEAATKRSKEIATEQ